MPSNEQLPTVRRQVSHVKADLLLRGVHMGLPWAVFAALTVFGNVLYLVSARVPAVGQWLWLTTALVLAGGLVLGGWDWHLRRHRMTAAGQLVGPVTAVAAAVMLAAFLQAGYAVPLVLLWLLGGPFACLGWDAWLHHAERHDLALGFPALAEKAGLGRAQLSARDRPAAPGQPAAPSRASRAQRGAPGRGSIAWPPGEVTPGDAAARVANLESAQHLPPGSLSLTPSEANGAVSDFVRSDPRALDVPDPWPGPYAPGAGMGTAFRMGTWQTGEVALIPRLPLYHNRAMGQTGSAKTTGWGYNQLAEGVTREGYAAMVIDIAKGEQFFGAWRPALHRFETDEEKALYLARGIHRARRARTDYLGRKHLAEWQDGCGLSFVDFFLAEAPDFIALLETARSRMAGAVMTMPDWLSDVKNSRSAGIAWNVDLQLTLATEMPTLAQGQMAHLCLGVEDKDQARFGLSARQRDAGCRPEMWGKKRPGTAYWDVPTLPDEYATVPMRFFYWGGQPVRAAFDYAADWPASARPLDDVTGEALEAEPAPPASHALPGPAGTLPGAPAGRRGSNVRQLFGSKRGRDVSPAEASALADEALRGFLARRLASGRPGCAFFTSFELQQEGVLAALPNKPDGKPYSRPWLYPAVKRMVLAGYAAEEPGTGKSTWKILPAVGQPPAAEGEEG